MSENIALFDLKPKCKKRRDENSTYASYLVNSNYTA